MNANMCYNLPCHANRITGRFVFVELPGNPTIKYCGQSALRNLFQVRPGCSRDNGSSNCGGLFAMDDVDRFAKLYKEDFGLAADVGYVYILKAENGLFKIGKSRTPKIRIGNIQTASPVRITVYRVFKSSEYSHAEQHLHRLFADFREIGEWFRLTEEELLTIDEIQGDHTLLPCYL